jgi:cellulose synthase/poly-beta-1,6-N-acetylglucosamine synthase-like glycosyltransferase
MGDGVTFPKVSIHIPAYFEPVEMLKQTLDAVSRLDYPNFECVVIINNTPDPEFWQPIQDHCRTLGERFKFINAEKVKGFKAGALRIAMDRTAVDAEIIGIIDADYVVQPDWLKDLVPVFADPKVGMIQAPQDHRDGDYATDDGRQGKCVKRHGAPDPGPNAGEQLDVACAHAADCVGR